jgi:hypothetical protein
MHPWQSVLLIILSLSLFYYGMYYEEIKEESQAPLALQPKPSTPVRESADMLPPSPSHTLESDEQISFGNLAEQRTLLLAENGSPRHISLHSDALLSPVFLEKVMVLMSKNPTAKKMILSPFPSSAFKKNESQIVRVLFTTREAPDRSGGLFLVCRGHSIKTSRLFASIVIQAYQKAISEETMDEPLISKFNKHREKMDALDLKINYLVEQIQKSARGGRGANIEEIALQAELAETTNELGSLGETLRQIESIRKNNPSPMAQLAVESIANYKTIPELVRMSAQLGTVLANENPDSFVKKEVSRNLDSTNQQINREITNAIDWIKSVTKEALERKKVLERKLVELRAKENEEIVSNPRYGQLKKLNAELSSLRENYREQFDDWKKAKKGFRFVENNVQE